MESDFEFFKVGKEIRRRKKPDFGFYQIGIDYKRGTIIETKVNGI